MAQIEKIVLKVGDTSLEMTLDEARELRDILKNALRDESEQKIIQQWVGWPYGVTWQYTYWQQPVLSGTTTYLAANNSTFAR